MYIVIPILAVIGGAFLLTVLLVVGCTVVDKIKEAHRYRKALKEYSDTDILSSKDPAVWNSFKGKLTRMKAMNAIRTLEENGWEYTSKTVWDLSEWVKKE